MQRDEYIETESNVWEKRQHTFGLAGIGGVFGAELFMSPQSRDERDNSVISLPASNRKRATRYDARRFD